MKEYASNQSFFSKIILFGEYSVIRKSKALAIPFSLYEGTLQFSKNQNDSNQSELNEFVRFLSRIDLDAHPGFKIDVSSFEFDISSGLKFESTIPQGFGVGSSGALCAAIYDRYKKCRKDLPIQELKANFALMESHFHGKSSGIDPLISYINKSIVIEKDSIKIVKIPSYLEGNGAIFLLNTGRARRTEPLVNLFLEKCNNREFSGLCDQVLTPINNQCINSFLLNKTEALFEFFRELSDFQLRHFDPMIPNLYKELWLNGLKNQQYYLKLCGAGGGGFILGMTKDFKATKKELQQHQIRPLFRF